MSLQHVTLSRAIHVAIYFIHRMYAIIANSITLFWFITQIKHLIDQIFSLNIVMIFVMQ